MSTRQRLTASLRPVFSAMALSIAARIVQLAAGLVLVGTGAWGVAALATNTLSDPWLLLVVLAAVATLKALARYVEQYQGHAVAFGLLAEMRTDFFRRAAPLAPAALSDTRSGDLVDRVTSDVDRVEVFYAHTVAPVVAGVVVPVLTVLGVGIWAGPILALVLGVAMVLVGLVVPSSSLRPARRSAEVAAAAGGELAAHVTDGIQGLAEAVVFDYGGRRLEEMDTLAGRVAAAEGEAARIDGVRAGLNQLVIAGTLMVVAALGAGSLQDGTLRLPVLAGTLAVSLVSFGPLRDLQQVKPSYDRAMAAADRIFSIVDRPPLVAAPPHPEPVPEQAPTLRFEGVTFTYPGREEGVRDLDLVVAPATKVAVVGPSGAGKSTIARLAARLWDPDRGRITLGGRDISDLDLSDLRSSVTVVTQESHLLSGTVEQNLRLGRPEAAPEELRRAARTAAVAEDIASLPEGYDTQVGELGTRLSGGQSQRIAVARGLLTGAPVVILDETTSELDVDTEADLLRRIGPALADRAVLIIAHRLTTVVDADEILVLDHGSVVERGTHDQLLALGGLYARLWARQHDEL